MKVQPIEEVWTLQHEKSQQQVDQAKKDFASCLAKAGLDVSPDESFTAAGRVYRSYITKPRDDPDSTNPELSAVLKCGDALGSGVGVVARPGVAKALKNLDTSGW